MEQVKDFLAGADEPAAAIRAGLGNDSLLAELVQSLCHTSAPAAERVQPSCHAANRTRAPRE
jgi:hypothetical protein